MDRLIWLALIGLAAQLVDGALGMAYGLTSSSFLLMFGIAPAVASASVHMAEVITTAASGISHLKFGNVDRRIVSRLILPGSIGAFLGALFLGSVPSEVIKPGIALILLGLGFFILYRFLHRKERVESETEGVKRENAGRMSGGVSKGAGESESGGASGRISIKGLIPLGFIAGFVDSTGGGGWGPITTPVLLSRKNAEARRVIGSVDTSEFAIAISSSLGFLIILGWQQVRWDWVIAIMIGGLIAAPIAAWLVRILPARLLGVFVGGMIIFTNTRTMLHAFPIDTHIIPWVYGILSGLLVMAILYTVVQLKKGKKKVSLQGK